MGLKAVILPFAVSFILSGALFFSAGWFIKHETEKSKLELINNYLTNTFTNDDLDVDFEAVSNQSLHDLLQSITAVPHLAGDFQDIIVADYIKEKFVEFGLDYAETKSYMVLLDYPNKTAPNKVYLMQENNPDPLYESVYQEENLRLENFIDAYLAYSPAGEVTGQLVYVNYGSKEDFELLADDSSEYYTNVTGKICITRYGQVFRGNKAKNAEDAGCVGLVIFSDPGDVAGEGQNQETDVYPETMFLPDTGIQRGSLLLFDGDPETPNMPSLPNVYRLSKEEIDEQNILPKIPCQPLGYRGAKEFMKFLSGAPVPEEWRGGLLGIDYVIGGNFNENCKDCYIKIKTNNYLERKLSPNVMGYIKGAVEPDRYVMVGNHRDAWGFGAMDPSSGTASMLEVARVLGEKLKTGWRPRRTIIFLSWGAEEFGLTGSREFTEEYKKKLVDRGVVYINSDTAVSGPIMFAEASPTISKNVIEAAKRVPYINDNYASYFDFWKEWLDTEEPPIWIPGAGSDHASFIFHAGVPVIDFGFGADTKLHPSVANIGYPAYHTAYETFDLVERIVDPGFHLLALSTKMTLSLVRDFAENIVLDFDLQDYNNIMDEFKRDPEVQTLIDLGVDVGPLLEAINKFENATIKWEADLADNMDTIMNSPFMAKYINDQMMNLDKTFLLDTGLPGRPVYSHAIMSPAKFDSYGSGYFPGIGDLLYDFDTLTEEEKKVRVVTLKKHVSQLMVVILRAVDYLKEVYLL